MHPPSGQEVLWEELLEVLERKLRKTELYREVRMLFEALVATDGRMPAPEAF
jgi:hypothetical protein